MICKTRAAVVIAVAAMAVAIVVAAPAVLHVVAEEKDAVLASRIVAVMDVATAAPTPARTT